MTGFPLATVADATSYGLTVTSAALLDASDRVREYTHRAFKIGEYTVNVRGPRIHLPQRPVSSVTSVVYTDTGTVIPDTGWRLRPGGWLEVPTYQWLTIRYVSTGDTPPGLERVVCQIAARIGSQPAGLQAGIQQQSTGPFQMSYGWDSYSNAAGLTAGERRSLDRLFPRGAGGPIVMRAD